MRGFLREARERVAVAWYALRGWGIAYKVGLRDGGFDLARYPKVYASRLYVYGAQVGIRAGEGPEGGPKARVTFTGVETAGGGLTAESGGGVQ